MSDFTEADVLAWFAPIRAPARQNSWPPAIRPIERAPSVQTLLHKFGAIFSELADHPGRGLPAGFMAESARNDLQIVLAQLGAARLLRIIDFASGTLPEAPQFLAQISQGGTANAHAIASSLRALTARDMLTRMFGPDRIAALQSCAEAAIHLQEAK